MREETDFAVLYKNLVDSNMEPDAERLEQTLLALLALVSPRDPPR